MLPAVSVNDDVAPIKPSVSSYPVHPEEDSGRRRAGYTGPR